MRVIDVVARAGRNLRQAKARTLLTSLAIGVGAFTITLALAAGEGGRGFADEIVRANADVHEVVVGKPQPRSMTGPQEYSPRTPGQASGAVSVGFGSVETIDEDDLDQIRNVEHVSGVIPGYNPVVEYIAGEKTDKKFVVSALHPFRPGLEVTYEAGEYEDTIADDEIIIPESYATALGYEDFSDAIGDTVTINALNIASAMGAQTLPQVRDFAFTIKGVTSDAGFAVQSQDVLSVSENAIIEMYDFVMEGSPNKGQYVFAVARVDDASRAEDVRQSFLDLGYDAETSEGILGTINIFINTLLAILLGFGALAVLTSVFGIINTQYISVLERTQQIGLMKALGARRKDIGRLFRFEAAWVGFLGGVIGTGLAIITGVIANPYISDWLDLGDTHLLLFVPYEAIAVIIGLMLVAMFAGFFPARKASKLDPIEALRTE